MSTQTLPKPSFLKASREERGTCKTTLWKQRHTEGQMNKHRTTLPRAGPVNQITNSSYIFCNSAEFEFVSSRQRRGAISHVLKTPSCVALTTENRVRSGRKASVVFCNSPWFGSRICTPAGRAHCWRTSSSGRSAPLGSFAPGTQLQIHLEGLERKKKGEQIKRWQTSFENQDCRPAGWNSCTASDRLIKLRRDASCKTSESIEMLVWC